MGGGIANYFSPGLKIKPEETPGEEKHSKNADGVEADTRETWDGHVRITKRCEDRLHRYTMILKSAK